MKADPRKFVDQVLNEYGAGGLGVQFPPSIRGVDINLPPQDGDSGDDDDWTNWSGALFAFDHPDSLEYALQLARDNGFGEDIKPYESPLPTALCRDRVKTLEIIDLFRAHDIWFEIQ